MAYECIEKINYVLHYIEMLYKSTRGGDLGKTFEDVMISTYASDGGLYIPMTLPLLTYNQLCLWSKYSFPRICAEILHIFTDIDLELLNEMTEKAFKLFNNNSNDPIPIRKYGNDIILLDTSLGPTMAFKDIGLQVFNQLLEYILKKQNKRANIVVETSGDTGPAAVTAVKGSSYVNIFCLYPYQRVSPMQELQMTTIQDDNVSIYRTDGTSDEQASVLKELFSNKEFSSKYNLCSINSINWFRVASQCSYYVWSYLQVYGTPLSIGKLVNYSVPSGALGNAAGGFIAKRMGLPIGKIICATNANDIVHRTISQGDLSMGTNLQTLSPAMDIQYAYNLERVLYYVCNENSSIIKDIMTNVEKQFKYESDAPKVQLDSIIVNRLQETFLSCSISDVSTLKMIKEFYTNYQVLLCPHGAIGVYASQYVFKDVLKDPTINVLTAHPAKFEQTINQAIGKQYELPNQVKELYTKSQRFNWLHKSSESWRDEWIDILKKDIINKTIVDY